VKDFLASLIARFERIPTEPITLIARIAIGTVFLRSGLLKLDGWADGTTLALFTDEYSLPLLPPQIAAVMATATELALPPLLFAGLFTRFAALALLLMALVIQLSSIPTPSTRMAFGR
jgi:putative oxidoreductase